MDAITVISLLNQAITGLSSLGLNLSHVAQMQHRAAAQGRDELNTEDLNWLRKQARDSLDKLEEAIKAAEEEAGN